MTFTAYKALTTLLWPSSVIMLLLVSGTVLLVSGKAQRWARRLVTIGVTLLMLCGVVQSSDWLVLPLEQRFPQPPLPRDAAGIIMLGGFEVTGVTRTRGQLQLSEAAERLTESVALAHRLPLVPVIFTGGDGTTLQATGSAASAVGTYLKTVGIDPGRIVLERRSRTTYENAVELRRMLKPVAGKRYLLVTSAYHMPRAVGSFRAQGFDIVAWPVDYRTRGWQDLGLTFGEVAEGLMRFDLAFKEWMGLLVYRALGRTSALWPGPKP